MNEELKVIISAEISKLKSNLENAKRQVKDFKSQVQAASADVDKNFQSMGQGIQTGVKAVGATLAGVTAALGGVAIATQEYRDDMAKLAAAFDAANYSTAAAKTAYSDLYRVIGETDQAVEASQQIALLANSEKDVAKWSELAAGVVGKFGDALQPETFYESANETLKLGEATGAYVQMLEGTGMSVEKFNEGLAACTTEEEKQAYMLKVTQEALGAAGSAFEKNNAKVLAQRDAQMKLQEALAKVGDAVAPVVTAFTAFAAEALAVVAPYIQSFAENYLPAIQAALSAVAEVLGAVFSFVSEHVGILATIAGIITAITLAIGLYNTVAAVKLAMDAAQVTTLGALIAAYAAQAAAMAVAIAPYVLIVAAIAAVIAIIVLCIKHWDQIKAKTKEVWSNIKQSVQNGVDKVVSFFQKLLSWVQSNWQGLLLLIVNPFAGAFKLAYDNCESFRKKVDTAFSNIKDGISNKLNSAKSTVTSIFSSIKESISDKINAAKSAVQSAVDKLKSIMNFKWSLPKLKMPKITISGKFSINPPSVPKFSISWRKLGGVFDRPTIVPYGNTLQGLGEAGAEAIVPLEKNTKWLDVMAEKITAKQGNTPIILEVDGKTFAQVSIDSINALTRQRGRLGLNLV